MVLQVCAQVNANVMKKLLTVKTKGMGLVEVIVAIGISVVTLTGAGVFSSQLVKRAQNNFMEISVNQLQGTINEQLRLVESGLKQDVVSGIQIAGDGFIKQNNAKALTTNVASWADLCSADIIYYNINLPSFSAGTADSAIYFLPLASSSNPKTVDGVSIPFGVPQGNTTQFGPVKYDSGNVLISIKKSIGKAVIPNTNTDLGNAVIFESIIYYNIYNKPQFSKSQQIRMNYTSVCPG
jgi:hypothetical protein